MQNFTSVKHAIGVFAAIAILAGCTNGGPSQLTPTGGAIAPNAVHHTMGAHHTVDLSGTLLTPRSVKPNFHPVPHVKQIAPNCCALQKTLFVTDAFGGSSFTGAAYAFDYVTGAALGSLAAPPEGFLEVQGDCTDNNGNVYFANTGLSTIDEYSHSGTYVTTLADPGEFPVTCAFDRSSGSLAVDNVHDASGGPGSISIYVNGVLQNTYYPPNMSPSFVGYEGNTGTLWLDGEGSSGFQYDKFSNGVFTPVPIQGASISFAGAVMWSGKVKSMVVGDQSTFSGPTFYHVSDTGVVTGSTVLQCTQQSDFCDVVQATIKGPGLVGPDAVALTAARFAFPAGGAPTLFYSAPFVQPGAAAVSSNKGGN